MSNKNKNRKGRKRDSRPDDIIRELDEVTEVTEDTEEPEAKAEDTDDGAEEKAAVRKEKKVPEKEALKDKPNKKNTGRLRRRRKILRRLRKKLPRGMKPSWRERA